MANCTVAPPRSTRIPVAASIDGGGVSTPFIATKGVSVQSVSPDDRTYTHTVISVTPLNAGKNTRKRPPFETAEITLNTVTAVTWPTRLGGGTYTSAVDDANIRNNNSDGKLKNPLPFETVTNSGLTSRGLTEAVHSSVPLSSTWLPESSTLVSDVASVSSSTNLELSSFTEKQTSNDGSKVQRSRGQSVAPHGSNSQAVTDNRSKVSIYKDWANHYLAKGRNKCRVVDLQADLCDGVLLAEVIEAVTGEKVTGILSQPQNSEQMVGNINTSLSVLATIGVNIINVSAREIKQGNLRSILGLFFNLSMYKQQQKAQHRLSTDLQHQPKPSQDLILAVSDGKANISKSKGGAVAGDRIRATCEESVSRIPSPLKLGYRSCAVSPVSTSTTPGSSPFSRKDYTHLTGQIETGRLHQNQQPQALVLQSDSSNNSSSNSNYSIDSNCEPSSNASKNTYTCSPGFISLIPVRSTSRPGSATCLTSLQSSITAPLISLQSSIPAALTSLQSSIPAPLTSLQSSIPAPLTSLQSSIPAPLTSLQSSIPAPLTNLQSSIPTPARRGSPSSGSQTLADKQSSKSSADTTCTSLFSRSSSNKHSMLDKFKFFKDKDKDKDKTKDKNRGVVKSSSKNSSTSTTSTSSRSDTDSRTSRSDTTTSSSFTSSQSSSSGDQIEVNPGEIASGAISVPLTSSKRSSKVEKKFIFKSEATKKDIPESVTTKRDTPDEHLRFGGPPPIPSAVGLGPPTGGPYNSWSPSASTYQRNVSQSQSRESGAKTDRSDGRQTDIRLTAASQNTSSARKSSRTCSSPGISKTQPSSSSFSKASKVASSSTETLIPTSSSSFSASSTSSGHKHSSSKSLRKVHKADTSCVTLANESKSNGISSKTSLRSHHSQLQHYLSQQTQHHLFQQQQLYQQQAYQMQKQHHPHYHQGAYSLPQQQHQDYHGYLQQRFPHHDAYSVATSPYNIPQRYIPSYAHNPGYATPACVQGSQSVDNVHPRTRAQEGQQQTRQNLGQDRPLDTSKHVTAAQSLQYVPVKISTVQPGTQPDDHSGRFIRQVLPQSSMLSPHLARHNLSVNVVKPTLSSSIPTASSQKSSRSDSNTQTNLSIIHKSASQKKVINSEINISQNASAQNDKSLTVTSSTSSPIQSLRDKVSNPEQTVQPSDPARIAGSTTDNAIGLCQENDSTDNTTTVTNKLTNLPETSTLNTKDETSLPLENLHTPIRANSPRLGVKMLGAQVSRAGSNVAVVQPHSGEKMETTFDTEVRTETIQKPSSESPMTPDDVDEKSMFVDDSGEAMNITPMQPILRSLPYGYFHGYSGFGGSSNRNCQVPGVPVTTSATCPSRSTTNPSLGMPQAMDDQSPNKFYSDQIKGSSSNSRNSGSSDPDYASESDTCECVSGYMSDGDILKVRNSETGSGDEWTSGYLSEGGASLYARRLQQRFREGMQAVRECMQKSTMISDEDSFDDSSSVSSGEVSDTIAEVGADENLAGCFRGVLSEKPYSCLKKAADDSHLLHGTFNNGPGSPGAGLLVKGILNVGASVPMGAEYNNYSNFGAGSLWGRKYSLPQTGSSLSNDPNKLLSSDPSDYVYGYGWPSSRSDGDSTSRRKSSSGGSADYAYHSEGDYESPQRLYSHSLRMKKDCETNTDQPFLLDASIRRFQTSTPDNVTSPNSGASGAGAQFFYRRSLSNSSGEPNMSSGYTVLGQGSTSVGIPLASQSTESRQRSVMDVMIPRPASAMDKPLNPDVTLIEGFNSSSLDRKKPGVGHTPSTSTGCTQTERDFQSNSLGRLRFFGNKMKRSQGDKTVQGSTFVGGTIISNPHATFSRDKQTAHYVNLEELNARISGSSYVPLEFTASPRNSGGGSPSIGSASMWLKSSASSNGVGLPQPLSPNSPHLFHVHAMSDSETLESLASPQVQAQIQQTRALGNARMFAQHGDMSLSASPPSSSSSYHCMRGSDSAYSSNKFPSFNEDLPGSGSFSLSSSPQHSHTIQASQTISPSSRFTFPMVYGPSTASPGSSYGVIMVRSNTQSSLPYSHGCGLSRRASREDDASPHGSTLSLSSSSSAFSSAEDKYAYEVRKLKRDLLVAQDKVQTLTNQLGINAHVVSAFEQSLSSMTARLQSLTHNSENKDTELNELRLTIEALKRQSKMTLQDPMMSPPSCRRHTTPGMKHINIAALDARFARQTSSDSVSSINSLSSACSITSQHSAHTDSELSRKIAKQAKKKGWLRSSFSKAFSRKKTKTGSLSDVETDLYGLRCNVSAPNSPLLQLGHVGPPSMKGSQSSGALCDNDINALKQALRDKDMKLTDIRLEALSSAHQLEQLRETMTVMKNEMSALKADNDRLHKLMSTSQSARTLSLSHGSMSPHQTRSSTDSLDRSFSVTDHSSLDMLLAETAAIDRDGKRVTISVVLGSNPVITRTGSDKPAEVLIGSMSVSGRTKWDMLDSTVGKIFKEYVLRVDPVTNLGLSAESIYSYVVGEVTRTKESDLPELLPIGYFVGETTQIETCLKGTKQSCVDSLAFETMIPKTVIQRYVSLLLEHHRIILCGPSGTGKTYLAQKLAEHIVLRSGRELTAGSVATFNVDHKSAQELRQYLANIADQCENMNIDALPSAIILDNLHHVTSLADVFNGFMSTKYQKCPYIIGTMSQSTCSTTNLQLHHNFRFVLCANHMEVKSFLGRFLRRRLIESEVRTGIRNNDLNRVVDWIPKVWAHLNKALESHSSADVTIGPRLFMSCPMDIAGSQVWFTDLWNYSLVEAVRDGLQMYGCQTSWEDPTDWVLETYPWPNRGSGTSIMHIQVDDLGYEPQPPTSQSSVTSKNSSPITDIIEAGPTEVE